MMATRKTPVNYWLYHESRGVVGGPYKSYVSAKRAMDRRIYESAGQALWLSIVKTLRDDKKKSENPRRTRGRMIPAKLQVQRNGSIKVLVDQRQVRKVNPSLKELSKKEQVAIAKKYLSERYKQIKEKFPDFARSRSEQRYIKVNLPYTLRNLRQGYGHWRES